MKKKILYIVLIMCLLAGIGIVFLLLSGQFVKEEPTIPLLEKITIEGEFIEDLEHPFSGPAIISNGNYFRIGGEKAKNIMALKNGAKLRVAGFMVEQKRTIPEAGNFSTIIEKIINIESFEFLDKTQQKGTIIETDEQEYQQGVIVVISFKNNENEEKRIQSPFYTIEKYSDGKWIEIRKVLCPCGALCKLAAYLTLKPLEIRKEEWNQKEEWCSGSEITTSETISNQVSSGKYRVKSEMGDGTTSETIYSDEFLVR